MHRAAPRPSCDIALLKEAGSTTEESCALTSMGRGCHRCSAVGRSCMNSPFGRMCQTDLTQQVLSQEPIQSILLQSLPLTKKAVCQISSRCGRRAAERKLNLSYARDSDALDQIRYGGSIWPDLRMRLSSRPPTHPMSPQRPPPARHLRQWQMALIMGWEHSAQNLVQATCLKTPKKGTGNGKKRSQN